MPFLPSTFTTQDPFRSAATANTDINAQIATTPKILFSFMLRSPIVMFLLLALALHLDSAIAKRCAQSDCVAIQFALVLGSHGRTFAPGTFDGELEVCAV